MAFFLLSCGVPREQQQRQRLAQLFGRQERVPSVKYRNDSTYPSLPF